MLRKTKPHKITIQEAFGAFLKLNGEYKPELFKEICSYLKSESDNSDTTLGFFLALHAFGSYIPAEDIFEAWKNNGNRKEFFRIDLFKRGKEENLSAHSTQLALFYPDDYYELQEKLKSKSQSSELYYGNDKQKDFAYMVANFGNPIETYLLGLDKKMRINNRDIAVEYEVDDKLCIISAFPLVFKYGYNLGEEE